MCMQRPNHTRYFFIAYVTSLSQFRVIFEKKASLNPPPPKNILMKHFTLYIKGLRINSVEIKKRIENNLQKYIYIYKSNLSNLKNVFVLLQICMVH